MSALMHYLQAFRPRPLPVAALERLRGAVGGAIGIAITGLISVLIARHGGLSPWLVAPLGASAVLVFAVPSSPLAQPWSVIGGNSLSALVGLLASYAIPDPILAAALAVGGAIGMMFLTRSLHPPGGAMALLVVLTHTPHWAFVLFPALTNSVLLVACGILFNTVTRHSYPHTVTVTAPRNSGLLRISEADLAEAVALHNEVLDIDPDELNQILRAGELIALRRMAAPLTAAEIMTTHPVSVVFGTPLHDAWQVLKQRDIKALPVVDRARRVIGLVSLDDFEREALRLQPADMTTGLVELNRTTPDTHSHKPEVVGQIMSTDVSKCGAETRAADLLTLFSTGDHRHVVVTDNRKKLIGIISASDVMRSIFHNAA